MDNEPSTLVGKLAATCAKHSYISLTSIVVLILLTIVLIAYYQKWLVKPASAEDKKTIDDQTESLINAINNT